MSMKGNLGLMLAMAGMMGGYENLPSMPKSVKKLSPEEEAELLKQRITKFHNEVAKEFERRTKEFKNWKCYKIHYYPIVASNIKNANKLFNYLLKSNNLSLDNLGMVK